MEPEPRYVCFQELFEEDMDSSGPPEIEYQGRRLVLAHRLQLGNHQRLQIRFEQKKGPYQQGLALDVTGKFDVDGEEHSKIVLWTHTAPNPVKIGVRSRDGIVWIKNAWKTIDGVIRSGHMGAAIYVEELSDGVRLWCNDGRPNDDLDDLVVRITLL